MNIKLKSYFSLMLLGALAASCENADLEEVNPSIPAATYSTSGTSSPNLIFEETFEGSSPFSTAHSIEVGTWDYALQYVSNPVFNGAKAARFEIREDQPLVKDGKRSEVTIVKGAEGHITKNTWYAFAAYFPSNGYEYDSEREIINQWYQSGSPATTIRTHKDRIILESGNTADSRKQYDLGPIVKDKWQHFVFHFIHSYDTDGLIEIWQNGTKVMTLKGGNMYDDVLPKWKIGLYKSAFKYGTSDVTKRIIYYDNIRVGNASATYEEMASGASSQLTPVTTVTPDATATEQKVVSFTLINASTDKEIITIANGASFSLSGLDVSKLNIRANTATTTAAAVKMTLSGAYSKSRIDDAAPYALFGDDKKGNYYGWSPRVGSYTLKGIAHKGDKDNLGAATGPEYSVNFTITK